MAVRVRRHNCVFATGAYCLSSALAVATMSNNETDPGTGSEPVANAIGSLSIQASALVRSIDSLSRIFWISLFGTFLTVLFAGLSQLEANAAADYLFLGEYQIPKSILPLTGVMFAVFVLWLTANRLRMLAVVLDRTKLAETDVDEIFFSTHPCCMFLIATM